MNEQHIDILRQRLEQLEQEIQQCRRARRWWKRLALLFLAVPVSVVRMGLQRRVDAGAVEQR